MKIFGIFGDPIDHSISPVMQNAAFRKSGMDACYIPFQITEERLNDAILGAANLGFGGLNLTIPLKEKALELDILHLDSLSRDIGAVNTISFKGYKKSTDVGNIYGHNTDGWGAIQSLKERNVSILESKVLLIGAGGAARAIAYSLAKEGAEISIANRNLPKAKALASLVGGIAFSLGELDKIVQSSDIIINATSVGMNEGDDNLINSNLLKSRQIVFDIVYNRETELLKSARLCGAIAIDGVMMLVHQGAKAFEIWTGIKAPVSVMEEAVRNELSKRRNR